MSNEDISDRAAEECAEEGFERAQHEVRSL